MLHGRPEAWVPAWHEGLGDERRGDEWTYDWPKSQQMER